MVLIKRGVKTLPMRIQLSSNERRLIDKIVARGVANGWIRGNVARRHWYTPVTAYIDISVTHLAIYRLDLSKWLEARDFDFLHDLTGIARHMDRSADGALTDSFYPRYAIGPVRFGKKASDAA